jgi:beta-galactosidase
MTGSVTWSLEPSSKQQVHRQRFGLTPHMGPGGLHADGSDLALVDVEVVDGRGLRVPTALKMIHFSLTGPAEWRGGIAQGSAKPVPINTAATDNHGLSATLAAPYLRHDNYILSPDLPVEGGINRVSMRSTTTPGTITLTAEAEGLPAAHLSLASVCVQQHNGLSSVDPSAALPVSLNRGPTPVTPSFVVIRTPVTFIHATAGANAGDAAKSDDDDETTSWTNASVTRTDIDSDGLPIRHAEPDTRTVDASPDTAWIEYTFARPVTPSEIELKLASFRLRRYPVRITLDGNTVYENITPTSLGYITLPLNTTKAGTRMRIQLTAPPFDVEEAHTMVELNGKIDQAEPKARQGKPILGIVEAEVYAKPSLNQ